MIPLYIASLCTSLVVYMPHRSWYDALTIPVSLYMADFISGCVHILLDHGSCGTLTPFVTNPSIHELAMVRTLYPVVYHTSSVFQRMCFEFQKHHQFPSHIVRKSMVEVSTTIVSFTWMLQCLLLMCFYSNVVSSRFFFVASTVTLCGSVSQLTHQSAHDIECQSLFVYYLRKSRLIITPEHHHIHHQTYDSHFPILSGWSTPLLNQISPYVLQNSK